MILSAFIIIGICLLLQAFFAGSEMAIISCNRIKLRHKAEMGDPGARLVETFLAEPEKFLGTTLVGYNVAVVVGSCVLNNIISLTTLPPGTENLVSLAILWPLVLIGGQIVPMATGRQYANMLSLKVARPLKYAYLLLFPLVYSASLLARGISSLFTRGREHKNPFVSREELELILQESHRAGVLDQKEKEMIEEIFDFSETTVKEAMVPLIDVIAAPEHAGAQELAQLIASSGHSRIPIYRERIDDIIGTVSATDLVGISPETAIATLLRAPYIVPETTSVENVLRDLQENQKHIAIVVDEYGGVSGIITLEDIIEEIVGEIEDEYDPPTEADWELRPGALLVDGKMRVEEFNDEFGQDLSVEESETIAGLLVARFGKIPAPGEEITINGLACRVRETTDRRVVKVEVTLSDPGTTGKS